MKNVLVALILANFLGIFVSFAQDSDREYIYLVIESPKIEGVDESIKQEMRRTIIQESTAFPGYQILLKERGDVDLSEISHRIVHVEAEKTNWGEGKNGYNLSVYLTRISSEQKLASAEKNRVEVKSLVFQTRILFLKIMNNLTNTKNTSEVLVPHEFFEEKKQDIDKYNEQIKRVTFSNKNILKRERIRAANLAELREKLHEEKKGESAFFDEPVEEIITKRGDVKEEKQEKNSDAKNKSSNNPSANVAGISEPETKILGGSEGVKWRKEFNISAGSYQLSIVSNDTIEVTTSLGLISFAGDANLYFNDNEYLSSTLVITRQISDSGYKLSNYNRLGSGYWKKPLGWKFTVGGGGRYETIPFVNLPELGGGLQAATIDILWLVGGLKQDIYILGRLVNMSYLLMSGFIGQSDYGDGLTSINGGGLEVSADTKIFSNIFARAEIGLQTIDASGSSTFKNESRYISLAALYKI